MSTLERDIVSLDVIEDDMIAFNEWLDSRLEEAIAEEAYWDEKVYGRVDREARDRFFRENPREKYDSPDIEYIER